MVCLRLSDQICRKRGSGRRGFAVRELILVAGIVAVTTAAVMRVNSEYNSSLGNHSSPDGELIQRSTVMEGVEVSLGDEFVCTVRLHRYGQPQSSSPHYVSTICIACRTSHGELPTVLEITSGENQSWHLASCRIRGALPREAVDDYRRRHHQAATASPGMTPEERWQAEHDYLPLIDESVYELDEPIMRTLPPELQQSGLLISFQDAVLTDLTLITAVSMPRLSAAIETAAANDGWTSSDPQTLLMGIHGEDSSLPTDEQQRIAQALVRRILPYLPRDIQRPEP